MGYLLDWYTAARLSSILTKYGFLCSEYKPMQTSIKKKPEKYMLSFQYTEFGWDDED